MQERIRESRPDPSRVDKTAFTIMVAKQQSAEALTTGSSRWGESTDDEFFRLDSFDFQPVTIASADVGRVPPFAHDALQAHLGGPLEELGTVAGEVVGIADWIRCARQHALKQHLTLLQLDLPQIDSVQVEQI